MAYHSDLLYAVRSDTEAWWEPFPWHLQSINWIAHAIIPSTQMCQDCSVLLALGYIAVVGVVLFPDICNGPGSGLCADTLEWGLGIGPEQWLCVMTPPTQTCPTSSGTAHLNEFLPPLILSFSHVSWSPTWMRVSWELRSPSLATMCRPSFQVTTSSYWLLANWGSEGSSSLSVQNRQMY